MAHLELPLPDNKSASFEVVDPDVFDSDELAVCRSCEKPVQRNEGWQIVVTIRDRSTGFVLYDQVYFACSTTCAHNVYHVREIGGPL